MKNIEDKILEKKNILLVLPNKPKLELLSAVFGFSIALESLNKKVSVISNDNYKKYTFLHYPKNISSKLNESGDIFVSIDTQGKNISELRYEKLDNEIRIHIDAGSPGLKKELISAKFSKSPYDLILIFGTDSKEDLDNFYKENNELFKDSDVVFINQRPYSQIIFELIHKLKAGINNSIATNILTSSLIESSYKENIKNIKLLKIISNLLGLSDHSSVFKYIHDKELINSSIIEIILKNITKPKKDLFMSKISSFDIEELSLSSKEIISVIIDSKFIIPHNNDLLALMESPKNKIGEKSIIGILVSEDNNRLIKFSKILGSTPVNNFILFSIKTKSLLEAENKINKLLKD